MSTLKILATRGIFGLVIMIFTLRPVLLSINVLKETFLWEVTLPPAVCVVEEEAFVEEEEDEVDPPEEIIDPEDSSAVFPELLEEVSSSPVK